MHEERAMGSSNGNVAVAELKYKPMQSRCEAAQFCTHVISRNRPTKAPPGFTHASFEKNGWSELDVLTAEKSRMRVFESYVYMYVYMCLYVCCTLSILD